MAIVETSTPIAWRVITMAQDGEEEVVFRVLGIIVAKNLPPVEKPLGR